MPKIYALPYNPLRVTSKYGYRDTGIPGATKWHSGVDLGADRSIYKGNIDGGSILAVADGVICNSYFNAYRGWVVIIDHGNGFLSLYQHLKEKGLSSGVWIKAGQRIGTMGNTGVGSGLHLHLEFIVDKQRIDPLPDLLNVQRKGETMEKIYEKIEDVPKWYRQGVMNMIALGGVTPSMDGVINISEDMCRIYTSFDKVGLLNALICLKGEK